MKYTKEERLEIGRQIFARELNVAGAAVKYNINQYTARDYLRLYKAINNKSKSSQTKGKENAAASGISMERYSKMSREELMNELISAKIEASLARKVYEMNETFA